MASNLAQVGFQQLAKSCILLFTNGACEQTNYLIPDAHLLNLSLTSGP